MLVRHNLDDLLAFSVKFVAVIVDSKITMTQINNNDALLRTLGNTRLEKIEFWRDIGIMKYHRVELKVRKL